MTSIPVKILVAFATIAALYALYLDTRKQKQIRLLVARIKERNGDQWQALHWLHRAIPRVGLRALFQTARIDDAESTDAYRRMRIVERRQMIALVIVAASIVIILTGTNHWGWSW